MRERRLREKDCGNIWIIPDISVTIYRDFGGNQQGYAEIRRSIFEERIIVK